MASTLVCFERYRSELNLAGARRLAERPPMESPFRRDDGGSAPALNARQLAHRRRMLEHQRRRSSAR